MYEAVEKKVLVNDSPEIKSRQRVVDGAGKFGVNSCQRDQHFINQPNPKV